MKLLQNRLCEQAVFCIFCNFRAGEAKGVKNPEQMLETMRNKSPLFAFGVDLVQVFLDRRVTRSAAELSYYLMMTLFPMLIIIIDVVGRLPLDAEDVVHSISGVLPQDTASLLGSYLFYVQHHQSTAMLTAAILTVVMAASAAFRGLLSISTEIYGREAFRSIWGTVISFVFSVFLVVLIYFSFLVILTGSWFLHWLELHFPYIYIPEYLPRVRLLILFCAAMFFLALLYWLTGQKGKEGPKVIHGAFLSAGLLTIGTNLFSWLIGLSSRFSVVYGSLASIIVLMMWLFFCGNIVIFGTVFNYVLYRHSKGLPVVLLLSGKL